MTAVYHYNYAEGTSYPQATPGRREGFYLAAPRDEPTALLYSPGLVALDRETEANVKRMQTMMSKMDPCYEYGTQHWHPDCKKKRGAHIIIHVITCMSVIGEC